MGGAALSSSAEGASAEVAPTHQVTPEDGLAYIPSQECPLWMQSVGSAYSLKGSSESWEGSPARLVSA